MVDSEKLTKIRQEVKTSLKEMGQSLREITSAVSHLTRMEVRLAKPDGTIRAYLLPQPNWVAGANPDESPGTWGHGILSVLRTKGDQGGRPYQGTVPLATGILEQDLNDYWEKSEQVPTALAIYSKFNSSGNIEAGGILIQALGEALAEEVSLIHQCVNRLRESCGEILRSPDLRVPISQLLEGRNISILEKRPLKFQCTCSWERVEKALFLTGEAELRALLEAGEPASIRCEFCTREYSADSSTLQRLINQFQSN